MTNTLPALLRYAKANLRLVELNLAGQMAGDECAAAHAELQAAAGGVKPSAQVDEINGLTGTALMLCAPSLLQRRIAVMEQEQAAPAIPAITYAVDVLHAYYEGLHQVTSIGAVLTDVRDQLEAHGCSPDGAQVIKLDAYNTVAKDESEVE